MHTRVSGGLAPTWSCMAAHGAPARTTSAAHMLTACATAAENARAAGWVRPSPCSPAPRPPVQEPIFQVLHYPPAATQALNRAACCPIIGAGFGKAAVQPGAMQPRTPHAGPPCSDLQYRPVACWSTRISSQASEGLGDGPGSGGRHVVGGAARRDAIPPTLAQQPRARFARHSRARDVKALILNKNASTTE